MKLPRTHSDFGGISTYQILFLLQKEVVWIFLLLLFSPVMSRDAFSKPLMATAYEAVGFYWRYILMPSDMRFFYKYDLIASWLD